MSISGFLNQSNMSVYREKLVEHKFISEVMLEMAKRLDTLDVLTSQAGDRFGYDIVLIHRNIRRFIQLKCKDINSTTSEWGISEFFELNNREGEFILIEIDYNKDFYLSYRVLPRNSRTGLAKNGGSLVIKKTDLSTALTIEELVDYLFYKKGNLKLS